MRTSEYPHKSLPFDEFNPAQVAVVPHLAQDVNLVVVLGTAAGKTALAECAFGYHLDSDDSSKVVYASPFRALSAEKHDAWRADPDFAPRGVVMSTGDRAATREDFEAARVIVMTCEAMDSKFRAATNEGWVRRVACVAVDEAHLLGDASRGAALECALCRAAFVNPSVRFVLLSATLGNAVEVAKWLKALNGKPTKCIRSGWRPCPVDLEVRPGSEGFMARVDEVACEAAARSGKKTVVFVHSKVLGREVVAALGGMGVRSAFHNASVSRTQRRKMEADFSSEDSGFDVLVSTSTLGAGVNVG